jgi:hypothetical protein
MSAGNIVLLCIVVGGITLFGTALAWASWAEARDQRRKLASSGIHSSGIAKPVGPGPAAHPAPKTLSRPF